MKNKKKKITIFLIILIMIFLSIIIYKNKTKNETKKLEMKYELIAKEIDSHKENKEVKNYIKFNENIYGSLTGLKLSKKYIILNKLEKAKKILNLTEKKQLIII